MRGLVLVVALAACGGSDDVDLTGIYKVDVDVGSSPCGTDAPVIMAPAFLKFHQDDFLGAKFFAFDSCTDAAATMCDSGGLFTGFTQPTDNGWKGLAYSSSFGTTCLLGFDERIATLDGMQLVIEIHSYVEEAAISEAQCTTDEAKKRGDKMPCDTHERIEATQQ
jgi:hypothetical protein